MIKCNTARASLIEPLELRVLLSSYVLTTLATFNQPNQYSPSGIVLDSTGDIFGTTWYGGASSVGTVFEVACGSGLVTALASFNGTNGEGGGTVVLDSSGDIFGAAKGGANGDGTLFEVAQGSDVITTLASFNGADGNGPRGVFLDSSGNLFGTTWSGGASGDGTVFEAAQGSGTITTLVSFNGANGDEPTSVAMDSSGNFFGTTDAGGDSTDGTVFDVAQGTGAITTLATLNVANGNYPRGVVWDSSGNLFGTTWQGGAGGRGTVFEITHGSGVITTLVSFNGSNGSLPSGVVLDTSGNLFGTTNEGNANGDQYGDGTVFEVARGTEAITVLASFNVSNGQWPQSGVVLDSSGHLFGATSSGGSTGGGTIFEVAYTATATATTITSSADTATYGQPVTFTATVTPAAGSGETGTVQFQIDGEHVGSPEPLSGNAATYSTSTLSVGSHAVLAVYSGNVNFAASTSATLSQGVVKASPWSIESLVSLNPAVAFSPYSGAVVDSSGDIFGTATSPGRVGMFNGCFVYEIAHGTAVLTDLASFEYAVNGVVLDSSDNIFGACSGNGYTDDGTIFEIAQGSDAVTALASFNGTNGIDPQSIVTMDPSGNLFGTTSEGGNTSVNGGLGYGTVFEIAEGSRIITTLALKQANPPIV
jgi:uncharacterized repeat protein (TIGR03803 family)